MGSACAIIGVAPDSPTARPWIWTKLILASLATLLAYERFSPWAQPWPSETKPLGNLCVRDVGARPGIANSSSKAQKRQANGKAKTKSPATQTILPLEA
jgi:hypothetical protein